MKIKTLYFLDKKELIFFSMFNILKRNNMDEIQFHPCICLTNPAPFIC